MSSRLYPRFDVLVVGGGPAGLAAAASAAESGVRTGLVDDNATLGGQIWRGESENSASEAARWVRRLRAAGVVILTGMRVFDQPLPGVLRAECGEDLCQLSYANLILATGARERFLPFPGWTLPNVMGAGGLQALVKSGLSVAGKRVVVAGSGPLLLAVAAYLRKRGAEVVLICEQASWGALIRLGWVLARQATKMKQALDLRKQLSGVPFVPACWPVAALGREKLERVVVSKGRTRTIACDYLACGFHLVPNTELAALIGCHTPGGSVGVDAFQRTSVAGVFCAGEPTGIGGVELSLIEGQIAGFAAADHADRARTLFPEREKPRRFADALNRAFALRRDLKNLAQAETIVCRCEDVPYGRLKPYACWRAAKLQTRCGMGPCQGRVCGPAAAFLFHWSPDSVRPPIFPSAIEHLAAAGHGVNSEEHRVTGGTG
jgi:D-hydroxyproline dehydrogenase subunit alpha